VGLGRCSEEPELEFCALDEVLVTCDAFTLLAPFEAFGAGAVGAGVRAAVVGAGVAGAGVGDGAWVASAWVTNVPPPSGNPPKPPLNPPNPEPPRNLSRSCQIRITKLIKPNRSPCVRR
jgi:hypothetical protein